MNLYETFGVTPEWARQRRIDYLIERCAEYKTRIDMARVQWEADIKAGTPLLERLTYWYLADVPNLEKKLCGYWKRLRRTLCGEDEGGLGDEMIQQAREANINTFIDVNKRGFARCVNPEHEDRHPSMHVRNGFAYCFSCGWKGDVIDVVMTKYGITFSEAVKMIVDEEAIDGKESDTY